MPTSVGWLKFYGFTTTTTTSSAICPFLENYFSIFITSISFCVCVKMNAFCVQYFYECNQSEERKKICIYLPSIFISILIPYHKKIICIFHLNWKVFIGACCSFIKHVILWKFCFKQKQNVYINHLCKNFVDFEVKMELYCMV